MYSKMKIAGHPIHPMLIAFPVACYVGTLVGFAVYGANGLVQDYHVGVRLAPRQQDAEPEVQHTAPTPLRRHHAA